MKAKHLWPVILTGAAVCLLCALSIGCRPAQQGPAPTTQSSLATAAADADAALDTAVIGITEGRRLGLIGDDEFNAWVLPVVRAARAATLKMEGAAKAGDQSTLSTASAAFQAAIDQLQPVLARVRAAKGKGSGYAPTRRAHPDFA